MNKSIKCVVGLVCGVGLGGCCDESYTVTEFEGMVFEYSHSPGEGTPVPAGQEFILTVSTPKVESKAANWPCFSLISSAHAMQECPRGDARTPVIEDIRISSDSDFDESHPAGTVFEDISYQSMHHFAGDPRTQFVPFVFVFPEPPSLEKSHRFTISMDLQNSAEDMTAETERVHWE